MAITTLRDIAAKVGVSETTVSNAINHRGKMSTNTYNKIMAVIAETGYIPNVSAQQLAHNRSRTIGIVVPDLENPFYGRLVKQVSLACKNDGFYTLIVNSFNNSATEEQSVYRMVSERIEGLLIAPTNYSKPSSKYIPLLEQNKIKYCYISNRIPKKNYPFVMTDLKQGSFLLVQHLLHTGKQNIYFLIGRGENAISFDRLAGCKSAFRACGISFRPEFLIYCDKYDFDEGYCKTAALLASGVPIDAIISINDFMAAGALSALTDASICVPDQIAVAGYDDMFFSRIAKVPLTTVRQNIDAIAQQSVAMLMDMIENDQQRTDEVYLAPELMIRESTR